MSIKRLKVAADFETTTDPNDLRVWASCAVDIDTLKPVHIGNDIESFFEWLKNKNTVCYFHNLKFDGEFILSYLLKKGYRQSNSKEPGTFSTLITDMGAWYSITVIFEKKKKKYKKVVFYDSLKKLPFKVAQIAKAFHLKDEKLSIDYKADRPVGHELTDEERAYIISDCRIVAAALKIQLEKGLKKMTISSDALNGYKDTIGKDIFAKWFPVLPYELDTDIRRAYRGGYVYLKPEHRNRRGLVGMTFDVNSLYPSVMYDCTLPYGYPIYFEGDPDPDERYNLFIVRLRCGFDVKPGHLPTIQLKNNRRFIETEYLTSSEGEVIEMTLTSVDLALFLDHYDVYDLKYIKGWKFKGVKGLFKEYIDYWSEVKATSKGAMRQLAKLMLNSLYGRFATAPMSNTKFSYMDELGVVRHVVNTPSNRKLYGVKDDVDEDELRDPVYTAMSVFITAYARDKTIRSGQAVYDRFIYADTDSLHIIGHETPDGLDVHPTRLGAWKNEGSFTDSKYIRAKTYMETVHEELTPSLKVYVSVLMDSKIERAEHIDGVLHTWSTKVTCAGMPDNVKELVTYDNFQSGSTFDGKLVPRRYPGGVILTETTFTIK